MYTTSTTEDTKCRVGKFIGEFYLDNPVIYKHSDISIDTCIDPSIDTSWIQLSIIIYNGYIDIMMVYRTRVYSESFNEYLIQILN